jgi:hypothetical protein
MRQNFNKEYPMKKSFVLLSLAAATTIMAAEAQAPAQDKKAIAMEGVKYIKMLGKELKGNVKAKLKKDPSGFEAATFCSQKAGEIAKKVGVQFPENVKVRRTALKYRNPDHKPDATDVKVMEEMQAAMQAGTFEKKPVVVAVDGINRVYVPLVVEKGCLKCHGPVEKIDPKVREVLAKKYPDDKAVGFKEGDLRGVVVAEIAPKK